MSLNRVVLIGRLTRDPEMKYTPQGVAVAQLGIAVQRFTKNETGDYDVDFFNVTAWRRSAEFASNYLTKGRLVSVDGRLKTRSWIDQATGQKRTVVEIEAENIESLDRKPDGETAPMGSSEGGGYEEPAATNPAPAPTQARAAAPAASAPRTNNTTRNAPPPPSDDDNNEDADPFADE